MRYPVEALSLMMPASVPVQRDSVALRADSHNEEPSDRVLMAHIAARDANWAGALEQLFIRHSPALLAFCTRFLRDQIEAEDLVHDVFVQTLERGKSFRNDGPLRAWLFSLAVNLARTRHRRSKLDQQFRSELAEKKQNASDPARALERQELRDEIDKAVETLSESERETFLLYWFGALSYGEISAITGISVPAAKVRVHRALAHLGKALQKLK
ncbi:MAG TPA: sigma-70 family RNA polymerase sigma factor [Planctomycetota bacterium]|jgi:RNA polymerase sigma-70 factor (ECF subfamily)